jgi:dihydropteroate synthase
MRGDYLPTVRNVNRFCKTLRPRRRASVDWPQSQQTASFGDTVSIVEQRRGANPERTGPPPLGDEQAGTAVPPRATEEVNSQPQAGLDVLRLCDGRIIPLPAVMGVLNVTPDSFSDGGRYLDPDRAAAHALEMAEAGAAIIDIGAESTRPSGAREVSAEVELGRLLPVLQRLRGRLTVPLSIDTRKPEVGRVALDWGAAIINDVSALSNPAMAALAAESSCTVVLMHMKGGPEDHIQFASYRDVVKEVLNFLAERAAVAVGAGIDRARIILDPGLGFAKTAQHNLAILANLERFCRLGYPVLIGASRKNFITRISGSRDSDVLFATNAVNAVAVAAGAAIIRVHDPAPAAVTARMVAAIAAARRA